MDYEFIWLLPLALLVIPAAVCYVLFSKINALGDSLDIITEELSALQKMIRDSRKEYRKPAGPAKKTIVEERQRILRRRCDKRRQRLPEKKPLSPMLLLLTGGNSQSPYVHPSSKYL